MKKDKNVNGKLVETYCSWEGKQVPFKKAKATKRKSYVYSDVFANRVVDGDTLYINIINTHDEGFGIISETRLQQDFRIMNLDAPEITKPGTSKAEVQHGQEAKKFAESLLSQPFVLTSFKGDRYGRYLAKIKLSDGKDFAEEMIKAGFQKRDAYEPDTE